MPSHNCNITLSQLAIHFDKRLDDILYQFHFQNMSRILQLHLYFKYPVFHPVKVMPKTPDFPENFHDAEFSTAARHASDNRECIRLLGLSFLQKGFSEGPVATLLDVYTQSVFKWLGSYKEGCIDAPKDKGGRGRKNKMNEEDEV